MYLPMKFSQQYYAFVNELEAEVKCVYVCWQAYFAHNPSHLQKILRELVKFEQSGGEEVGQLRDTVLPLLKGNQVLEREFLLLFASEPPPPDRWDVTYLRRFLQ